MACRVSWERGFTVKEKRNENEALTWGRGLPALKTSRIICKTQVTRLGQCSHSITLGKGAPGGFQLAVLAGLIVWLQLLPRLERKKLGQTNDFENPELLVFLLILLSVPGHCRCLEDEWTAVCTQAAGENHWGP